MPMPCVSSDGKPTKSGIATLTALRNVTLTPKDVSEITGHPLFKVRSGLRELVKVGFVEQSDNSYKLTQKGSKLIP